MYLVMNLIFILVLVDNCWEYKVFSKPDHHHLSLLTTAGHRPDTLLEMTSFNAQVDYLIQQERLTREEVIGIADLVKDTEAALNEEWPGVKIIPYGSIISGIGLRSSDIDLYVSLPPWAKNYTPAYKLVVSAANILLKPINRHLFKNITVKHAHESIDDVPIMSFYHEKSKRVSDLSFNTIAVFDNKLLTYLVHTDNRVFKLMLLVKLWGKVLKFPSHVSCLLRIFVVFYLQQLDMLPPIYLLQKMSSKNDSVRDWNTSFEEPFYFYYTSQNTSLSQLLGGFFQYYSNFDFKNNIISTFAGIPIRRVKFIDVRSVPNIFVSYKQIIGKGDQRPLNISSEFCVPQFFVHNFNSGNKVNKNIACEMVRSFKIAAEMYLKLNEQVFLSVLFKKCLYLAIST